MPDQTTPESEILFRAGATVTTAAQDWGRTRLGLGYDYRILAPYYAATAAPCIVFSGDSTTEQMAGLNLVAYAGTLQNKTIGYCSALGKRAAKLWNFGHTGQTMTSFVSSGATNSGSNLCSAAGVAAKITGEAAPVVVLCYGINDLRGLASIAGTTFGNAAQVTVANTLQAQFISACSMIYAANSNVRIILRMPNAHTPTSSYFSNSVTGQNLMDIYRLAWRGDATAGVSPLDTVVNSAIGKNVTILFDTLRHTYADTSYAYQATVDADGLHPSLAGYDKMLYALLRLLSGPDGTTIASAQSADAAYWSEQLLGCSAIRPRDYRMINLSGQYQLVGDIAWLGGSSGYVDFGFRDASEATAAFGASSGSDYGVTTRPAMALGDYMVFKKTSGTVVNFPIAVAPLSNQGAGTLRWTTFPDTGYTNGLLASGDTGQIWRPPYSSAINAARNEEPKVTYVAARAKKTAVPVLVRSSAYSAITVQEIGVASGHTIVATDTICFSGGDDTITGMPLTGATITAGSRVGETVITLNSNNWTRFLTPTATILY